MYLDSVTFRKLFNPFPGFAFVLLKYFIQITLFLLCGHAASCQR